jgi:hypothetical protein
MLLLGWTKLHVSLPAEHQIYIGDRINHENRTILELIIPESDLINQSPV